MAFVFQHLRLYKNAAKIFGAEGVLCRKLEFFEWKVVYEACGSCYVISTSAWVYFFEKKFSRAESCAEEITCLLYTIGISLV